MGKIQMYLLLATALALLLCRPALAAGKPSAIFVLGDSFSDTGNANKTDPLFNRPWRYPYGITSPGHPAGRFSNGKVSTDFLAELIGLPSPIPYKSISSSTPPEHFKHGINFAVSQSGVFPNLNLASLYQQVEQLEGIISKNGQLFTPQHSIVFLFSNGNDYARLFAQNASASGADFLALADKVASGHEENIKKLYNAGFRYFAVGNLIQLECIPSNTGPNHTACLSGSFFEALSNYHNSKLSAVIQTLQTSLPGAQLVELDVSKAFNYVFQNPHWFGFPNPLADCCSGTTPGNICGDKDANGNPLYTVCAHPEQYVFWDDEHPSEAGWEAATNLLFSGFNITGFSPNLFVWLNTLNLSSKPKYTSPEKINQIAANLVQTLQNSGEYPQLLQLISNADILNNLPTTFLTHFGAVTAFVPTEATVQQQLGQDILQEFSSLTSEVALLQLVYGFWPPERLLKQSGHFLRTLGGAILQVLVEGGSIFLKLGENKVSVVHPSFFSVKGVVLVHQTSALLLPRRLSPLLRDA